MSITGSFSSSCVVLRSRVRLQIGLPSGVLLVTQTPFSGEGKVLRPAAHSAGYGADSLEPRLVKRLWRRLSGGATLQDGSDPMRWAWCNFSLDDISFAKNL